MLGKIGVWRHVIAGGSVGGIALLAATGVIGRGTERFDSKVVTVAPAGEDGVRIREVVDQDFGGNRRHGYERIVNTTFGEPIDIEASSPDASADIDITRVSTGERIRLGDPDKTYTGQHRYVLSYTLPDAQLSLGELALNIIGDDRKPEELETRRFEVVVTGFDLANATCNAGEDRSVGGCTLQREGDVYRAVISPLKASEGITIGGTITGRIPIVEPADPPLPERRPDNRLELALATIPLGLLSVGAVYFAARRTGRNEVFAGGAADAAFGSPLVPTRNSPQGAEVRFVADSKMDELATIEFVPPKGIEPWQGSVLLNEKIDRTTVSAWISGLVAKEAITLTKEGDSLVLRSGPHQDQLDGDTKALVDRLLDHKDELELGTYNASFAGAWNSIGAVERDEIAKSGWWKRLPPGSTRHGGEAIKYIGLVIVLFVLLGVGSLVSALLGSFNSTIAALIFAVLVPFIFAHFLYSVMRPARSASGSALALRAESFRRFLAASEGKHVNWAWKQGLLREYSAWAVALGAADAWGRALASSNVPAPDIGSASSPIWLYTMGSSFTSTQVAPSPSGSSGGGSSSGFSGGSVGGGGGGGSSGSW
jgi:Predicted membrane protein (DUF2207)